MKYKELLKDAKIQDWLDEANLKDSSVKAYLWSMQSYTDFVSKTPQELISEAKREQRKGLDMDERKIRSYLNRFRKYMIEDQKLAPITVRTRLVGVKSFYQSFYIELPRLKRIGKAKPLPKNVRDIPTKEDIREVLKYCDVLERAIIFIGCSSGLGAAEIINLRIDDFKKGYDSVTQITTLKLRREKEEVDFFTFLTPEASRAVLDYLTYRERNQFEKQAITRLDGFLFVQRKIPAAYQDISEELNMKLSQEQRDESWLKRERIRQIDNGTLMHMFQRLSKKAQKQSPKGQWNLIRSHNMRKFFSSTLKNANCQNLIVEYWMGHSLNDVQGAYTRFDPKQLVEVYKQYMPLLTFADELNIFEHPKYKDMLAENHTLAKAAAEAMVDRSEYEALRADYDASRIELELSSTIKLHEIEEGVNARLKQMNEFYDSILKNVSPERIKEIQKEEGVFKD